MTTPFNDNRGTSLPLAGRHAVVTGANGGIGEAICLELARHGASVTLLGLDRAGLEATRARLPGDGHGIAVADITDHAVVARVMAEAAVDVVSRNLDM